MSDYPLQQANKALAKKLNAVAIVLSVIVLALVGLMRRVKLDVGIDFSFLPPLHATFNALVAVALIAALYYVRKKQYRLHQKAIYVAMFFSALFLLSYVAYHFTTAETLYGDFDGNGELSVEEIAKIGGMRTLYLVILLSHIILAGLSLPFILFTFIKGYTGQYAAHRRMAKWVFPVWLYVAITGPVVYLMLMPFYN